jgi:hypothetical protein
MTNNKIIASNADGLGDVNNGSSQSYLKQPILILELGEAKILLLAISLLL